MVVELKEPGRNDRPRPERKEQDRDRTMLCPKCQVSLHMAVRRDVEIDYCPNCRGVWLDRGELDKIIERSIDILEPKREKSEDRDHEKRKKRKKSRKKERLKDWLEELFD